MPITGHHVARRVPAMPVDGPSLPHVGDPFTLVTALDALERWQRRPSDKTRAEVARALEGFAQSAAARGALLEVSAPPLPKLAVGVGTLTDPPDEAERGHLAQHLLGSHEGHGPLGRLFLDAPADSAELAVRMMELAVDAAWSRAVAPGWA